MSASHICDDTEFHKLVEYFSGFNASCKERLLFNVGTGAGFYSELGSMLECMLYCYHNKIAFSMYADSANFANENGWEEFYLPFCELNHDSFNKVANYRFKNYYRRDSILLPNFGLRRFLYPSILKLRSKSKFLTQDVFSSFTSAQFKDVVIDWPEFGLKGRVGDIYAKLRPFAMRLNSVSQGDVESLMQSINLPTNYISAQIRSGDKSEEFDQLVDVKYFLAKVDELKINVENIFIFTDDFRNIIEIKESRPSWNLFYLTGSDERGYYNSEFYKRSWEDRRRNLIKLFSMVEICIQSDFHIGIHGACVSAFIGSAKAQGAYIELRRGVYKKTNLFVYGVKHGFGRLLASFRNIFGVLHI